MKFCAFREYESVAAGVLVNGRVVALDDLNDVLGSDYGPTLDDLLARGQTDALLSRAERANLSVSGWKPANLRYAPPVARPPKIWGVGLNFVQHAADLGESAPEEAVGWMRPSTTLVGAGAAVRLPPGVGRVTAEAEIGIVLGAHARALPDAKAAREAVFGFVPVLDLTAEELLLKNPRYLTRAKSYDGFCVVGPFVTTKDEWEPTPETSISTEVDGVLKRGVVSQMRHDPYELVRQFSHVFSWQPGDVLLTGTPGALPLTSGASMTATIDGLEPLHATVA